MEYKQLEGKTIRKVEEGGNQDTHLYVYFTDGTYVVLKLLSYNIFKYMLLLQFVIIIS